MDVIRHDYMLTELIAISVEEAQCVSNHFVNFGVCQNAGAVTGVEPSVHTFCKVATKLLNLAFCVRRRIQCQPTFLLLSKCCQLCCWQGIAKMKCHKVGRSSLAPMRKIAPVHAEIGLWIEVVGHTRTHHKSVILSSEISDSIQAGLWERPAKGSVGILAAYTVRPRTPEHRIRRSTF